MANLRGQILRQVRVLQETQSFGAELQAVGGGQRDRLVSLLQQGQAQTKPAG